MYVQDAGVMTCFTTSAECVMHWDVGWVVNLMSSYSENPNQTRLRLVDDHNKKAVCTVDLQ